MNIEEAIKILDYKINMYKEDVFIGDLDKTNIEAIKKVLEEIERLNNIINEFDKLIKQYSKNDYYYKYNGKFLKSEIINDLKTIRGVNKEC